MLLPSLSHEPIVESTFHFFILTDQQACHTLSCYGARDADWGTWSQVIRRYYAQAAMVAHYRKEMLNQVTAYRDPLGPQVTQMLN